ncbi:MAG TPA: hypothetical protein VFB25_01095 [Gaiellaceae bacterium]|nr:hypothetical protein [Gaiellaceae bacterium]
MTLFSLPKPFGGDAAAAQETALASWRALGDEVQVVLVGDELGIAEAAKAAGVEHIADVARSPTGTPRLDDAFARVDAIARHPLRLFVNADIVLLPDLLDAVRVVRADRPFLLVGQTRDLRVVREELEDRTKLRARALAEGRLRGAVAIDWFVFPAGLFDPMPPFLVGRASFDNWMIWRGRQEGPVVDATADVVAIHQPHDYGHLAGGLNEAYFGAEAQENMRLAGGKTRMYTLHDASHRLVAGRLRRNHGAIMRWRDVLRRIAYKLRRLR